MSAWYNRLFSPSSVASHCETHLEVRTVEHIVTSTERIQICQGGFPLAHYRKTSRSWRSVGNLAK